MLEFGVTSFLSIAFFVKIKCGVRDLNPRPSAWEADVVPGWTNSANPHLKPNII